MSGMLNLGKAVGSTWWDGDGITGSSTSPTVFPFSGVTYAYVNDKYLNTSGSDRGNVYSCVTKGDSDTAEWVYVGSILGATPEVVDNLTTDSHTKALSAAMGKRLNDILNNTGLYPYTVTPTSGDESFTASLVIEDKDTTFTLKDQDDNTGTYSRTSTGGSTATVNITIGSTIGFPHSGAVLTSINSSDARIYSYKLYNAINQEIFSETPSIWEHITNDELNIAPFSEITEGSSVYITGRISKIINGIRTTLYPITHSKAVWFNKANNKTVYDKITEDDLTLNSVSEFKDEATNDIAWFGTSTTDEAIQDKVVATADGNIDTLTVGQKVKVLFSSTNTDPSPRLNVDSTGAKPIYQYGSIAPTLWWKAGDVVGFVYDGTGWQMEPSGGQLSALVDAIPKSYIGMVIESTTLNTKEKVIAFYGGTDWIQHTGYVMRGASTGVVANSAAKTGGNDDLIIPYHNHSVSAVGSAITGGAHQHKTSIKALAANTGSISFIGDGVGGTDHHWDGYMDNYNTTSETHVHDLPAHNTNYAGTSGNTTNANIPNYKSVYIWERTA